MKDLVDHPRSCKERNSPIKRSPEKVKAGQLLATKTEGVAHLGKDAIVMVTKNCVDKASAIHMGRIPIVWKSSLLKKKILFFIITQNTRIQDRLLWFCSHFWKAHAPTLIISFSPLNTTGLPRASRINLEINGRSLVGRFHGPFKCCEKEVPAFACRPARRENVTNASRSIRRYAACELREGRPANHSCSVPIASCTRADSADVGITTSAER